MAGEERISRWGYWEGNEVKAIQVFFALFSIFAILNIALSAVRTGIFELSFWSFVIGLATDLLVAFALASFIMGIFFIFYFRKEGVVPFKNVVRSVFQVSLVVGLFFTLVAALDAFDIVETGMYGEEDEGDGALTGLNLAMVLFLYFILTFAGTLVAVLAVLTAGFGMMGTLYMLEIGMISKFLVRLENITASEEMEDRVLMWFFNIPRALDTSNVIVDEPSYEGTFPWKRFRTAVAWQIVFGLIVAVYISLNPWLGLFFTIDLLFRFVSAAIVIVPLLVLPWFIHMRMGSRIGGAHKDFYLYTAMRQRTTGLLITAGTILIFVRLAVDRYPLEDILFHLFQFSLLLVLLMIGFSFIYFNFIENKLAVEVYRRWMGNKDGDEMVTSPKGIETDPAVTRSE